ncbi:MAG: 2-amino-4-hydroxy-6-hydroxymethyldihydropteridine diphosphokinase [Candidatus Cloacimonetes bacterium]|nr:2-amino-4-hydroxy-6-hydroxymethyldihydropteridine diphosphokinase [Candidatus Cloacimonadota bacterium]
MVRKAFVALGSNLGNRHENIETALVALNEVAGLNLICCSKVIETSPFGVTNQPDFLNAVALFYCQLEPLQLLKTCQQIETNLGRIRTRRWGARTIDIDILSIDDLCINITELTLPHPGIAERKFVLKPLTEIAPDWKHPQTGLTAKEMLRQI